MHSLITDIKANKSFLVTDIHCIHQRKQHLTIRHIIYWKKRVNYNAEKPEVKS